GFLRAVVKKGLGEADLALPFSPERAATPARVTLPASGFPDAAGGPSGLPPLPDAPASAAPPAGLPAFRPPPDPAEGDGAIAPASPLPTGPIPSGNLRFPSRFVPDAEAAPEDEV